MDWGAVSLKNLCTSLLRDPIAVFEGKGHHQKFDNHRRAQFQFRHDRDGGAAPPSFGDYGDSDPCIPNTYFSRMRRSRF
jgi:hypothetical protein